jgi:hypothetical protein
LRVTLALRSDRILAGQPLVLTYALNAGQSSAPLSVYPPAAGQPPWFTLSLREREEGGGYRDLSSTAVTLTPQLTPVVLDRGAGGAGAGAQKALRGGLVLRGGQFTDLMPPSSLDSARYERRLLLVARVRLPYSAGAETASRASAAVASPPRSFVEREISLPFTVEYDARKLDALARTLARRLTPAPETGPSSLYSPDRADLPGLFLLYGDGPQEVQREFLRGFSNKPRAEAVLTNRLYKLGLGTPEVIDLLADMNWKFGGKSARDALALIHYYGLADVKAHVERVFAEHREKVPRPTVLDL